MKEDKYIDFRLKMTLHELKNICTNLHSSIFIVDESLNILFFNNYLEKVLLSRQIKPQKFLHEIITDPQNQIKLESALTNNRVGDKFTIDLLEDGEEFFINCLQVYDNNFIVCELIVNENSILDIIENVRSKIIEFAFNNDYSSILEFSLNQIEEITKSEVSFFHTIYTDSQTLKFQAWSTKTKEYCDISKWLGVEKDISHTRIWKNSVTKKKTIVHNNISSFEKILNIPEGHIEIKRELVTPIIRNKKVVAILGVGNKKRKYSKKDIKLIEKFSDYVYEIFEKKIAQENQKEYFNKIEKIIENLSGGILLEKEGIIEKVNNGFIEIFNLPLKPAQLVGTKCNEAAQIASVLFEEPQKFLDSIDKHLNSKVNCYGEKFLLKDGRALKRDFIYIGSKPANYLWHYFDVTNQHKREIEIIDSRYRAEKYFDIANVLLVVLSKTGEILKINKKGEDILEYEHNELIGKNWLDLIIDENDKDLLSVVFNKLMNNSDEYKYFENICLTKAGSKKILSFRNSVITDNDANVIGILSSGEDITEKKESDAIIKSVMEKLTEEREIFLSGNVIVFKWSLEDGWPIEYVSENVENVLGYTKHELESKQINYKDLIHPDCYQRIKEETKSSKTTFVKKFEHEPYRLIHKNGEIIWVIDFTQFTYNDKRELIKASGYVVDITKQKVLEEQIQQEQEKYKTFLEQAPLPIIIHNQKGIIFINSIAIKLFEGKKQEEFLGKNLIDFIVKTDEIKLKNQISQIFKDERVESNEEIFKFKSLRKKILEIAFFSRLISFMDSKSILMVGRDVSIERRQMEEINILSKAVQQSPVFVIIANTNKEIEYVNDSFAQKIGYELDEIKGKQLFFAIKKEYNPERLQQIFNKIFSGENVKTEFLINTKLHEEIWVEIHIDSIKDISGNIKNILVLATDITERKSLEAELNKTSLDLEILLDEKTDKLKESESRYKILAETTENFIVEFDENGNILFVNTAIKNIEGFKEEKVINQNLFELTEKGFLGNSSIIREKIIQLLTKREKETFEAKMPWGNWIRWTLIPEENEENGNSNFIAFGSDITKHKNLEQELEVAYNKEKNLNVLKSQLIRTVSHEFKTPLTGISAAADSILRTNKKILEPRIDKNANQILMSVSNLNSLINDIVYLNKSNEGELKPEVFRVNLDILFEDILSEMNSQKRAGQKIILTVNLDNHVILSDSLFLKIILTNLITNAVKYSFEDGEIKINVYNADEKFIAFEVVDNGQGIRAHELDKIWTEFYRSADVVSISGSGLGLSIVKNYTKVLGGKIEVESKYKVGSKFIFYHPQIKEQ